MTGLIQVPSIKNVEPAEALRRQHEFNKLLALGKNNSTGTVTLAINVTTTTVSLAAGLIGINSYPFFTPTTAHAIAEWQNGTFYVSTVSPTNNNFIITHANNAQNDRTYYYVLLG